MRDAEAFAACLAHVLGTGDVPVPDAPDPFVVWRGWLAGRGLGLVRVEDPAGFSWAGFWIAGPPWRVMFGVPSGPVWPGDAPAGTITTGFVVAPFELSAARARPGTSTGAGVVEAIYTAPAAEAPMRAREAARATEAGLDGDRYAAGAGTFSTPHALGHALTLIEAEALEDLGLPPEQARRNVVTRGVSLNALVGRSFRVGEAECRGQRLCEPCAHWQRLTRPGVLRAFVHRGGLRADVVAPGVIRPGDAVVPA